MAGAGYCAVADVLCAHHRQSDRVGCFCVLTHPLDDEVRALYASFGFKDLPFDPAHSIAVRIALCIVPPNVEFTGT